MTVVDGRQYLTKEEAARRCFDYAEAHPGTTFRNCAHGKFVQRETTAAEREAQMAQWGWAANMVTVYRFHKLLASAPVVKAHPELRGLWYGMRGLWYEVDNRNDRSLPDRPRDRTV